jgi:hypothetical protein
MSPSVAPVRLSGRIARTQRKVPRGSPKPTIQRPLLSSPDRAVCSEAKDDAV